MHIPSTDGQSQSNGRGKIPWCSVAEKYVICSQIDCIYQNGTRNVVGLTTLYLLIHYMAVPTFQRTASISTMLAAFFQSEIDRDRRTVVFIKARFSLQDKYCPGGKFCLTRHLDGDFPHTRLFRAQRGWFISFTAWQSHEKEAIMRRYIKKDIAKKDRNVTIRDGRDDVYDNSGGLKKIVTIVTHRHGTP